MGKTVLPMSSRFMSTSCWRAWAPPPRVVILFAGSARVRRAAPRCAVAEEEARGLCANPPLRQGGRGGGVYFFIVTLPGYAVCSGYTTRERIGAAGSESYTLCKGGAYLSEEASRGTVAALHKEKFSRRCSALQRGGKLRAIASKVGAGVLEE